MHLYLSRYCDVLSIYDDYRMEQARRNAIAELRGAGRSPADIAKVMKYPRTTVYDVCKKYDKSGDVSRANHKLRRERKLISRFLNGLKRSVKANPTTPMTILAKKRVSTGEVSEEASPN